MIAVDNDYLAFIRTKDCLWCGSPPPNDADHLRNRKWRESTRVDWTVIASCRRCHSRRHNVGTEKMLELNRVKISSLVETVAMQLVQYFEDKQRNMVSVPF